MDSQLPFIGHADNFSFQAWGSDDIYSMVIVVAPVSYERMADHSSIDPLELLGTLSRNSCALPLWWEAIIL